MDGPQSEEEDAEVAVPGGGAVGAPRRLVTDGDLRSGWVSLPLLLAVVWLNDLPVLPVAAAAGVPLGPAYAYVENVLLEGATRRGALLLVAVGAFAALAIVEGLALAMWLLLGGTAGMQALGYAERWGRTE